MLYDMNSSSPVTPGEVRSKLLEYIATQNKQDPYSSNMQAGSALRWVTDQLKLSRDIKQQRLLLTEWHELFRTGILAWGHDLSNPSPPFCHVTDRGARALENLQRDPSNPAAYIAHLEAGADLGDIAKSYVVEALDCYTTGSYKAAAVMIGAASERLVLNLRDSIAAAISRGGNSAPNNLNSWQIKKVSDSIKAQLDQAKKKMPRELADDYEAYWSAFTSQIRVARNEAGHPKSIDPLTPDAVHAAFLVFPEAARLATEFTDWAQKNVI
ncbi:hypothetical protein Noc_1359 [Nitrosococcus oceani ATCC 19707]|uniref:Uncharacterized protein n=2 Tax=Nitrosococcus oceani TaxID=1229 RepID=Q3JBE3_NITOC|nr:hypothetical protein Noc_1359 [Nitrosococcus oceani ATCC 19707]GEM19492.1 hypothetical protein NONS58_08790 [Nitrosococcus oceani]